MDRFIVPAIGFDLLYAFVIAAHGPSMTTMHGIGYGIAAAPTARAMLVFAS